MRNDYYLDGNITWRLTVHQSQNRPGQLTEPAKGNASSSLRRQVYSENTRESRL